MWYADTTFELRCAPVEILVLDRSRKAAANRVPTLSTKVPDKQTIYC